MKGLWKRRITVLVIPWAADRAQWQLRLSVRRLALVAAAWAGLTLLVLLLGSGLADYGLVKADNGALRARLERLSREVAQSRAELDAAREADQRIRALLRLPPPPEAVGPPGAGRKSAAPPLYAAAARPGSGGPGPADRSLLRGILREPARPAADPIRSGLADLRRLSRARVASYQEISAHLAWRRRLLQATPCGWPSPGRITSRFGTRFSPLSLGREFHPGLDIANPLGSLIRATADGTVVRARRSGGYGRLVMVRHDLGYATLYGHASRLFVREGARIKRGQVVAATGSTGRSTGPHLHYEVWFHGKAIDPSRFLKEPGE